MVHSAPDPDELTECKLLSGTFATFLQFMLGVIALSVLVFKRYQEVPRRPVVIWAFDASKQLVGAGFAHVANLMIAILLYQYDQHHVEETAGVDQCAFYFVNFSMDTSIGVFFNWVFLEAFSAMAAQCKWTALTTPGDYGHPIQITIWFKQLSSWLLIIFVTKLVIALLIVAFEKPLSAIARWLFAPLQPYPKTELALVMIACPVLMNALQFWVQDSFLKKDVHAECMLAATESPVLQRKGELSEYAGARHNAQADVIEIRKIHAESEDGIDYSSDGSTDTTTTAASSRAQEHGSIPTPLPSIV